MALPFVGYDRPIAKEKRAYIENHDDGTKIYVMFNPVSYKYDVKANADTSKNDDDDDDNRIYQYLHYYKGSKEEEFSVELFFDTYEELSFNQDVRKVVQEIIDLVKPTVDNGDDTKRPPKCSFVWGDFKYTGMVTEVKTNFTKFLKTGIPVRADLTVEITPAFYTDTEILEWSGNEACRKIWLVKANDRLDLIAYEAYRDPSLWLFIAKHNKISNPMKFPTRDDIGRQLILPHIS